MPDSIDSLFPFFDANDLGHSVRNGLLVLFFGLSIIGNNQFCSRSVNAIFSVCGVVISSYGLAHEFAAAYFYISAQGV